MEVETAVVNFKTPSGGAEDQSGSDSGREPHKTKVSGLLYH